MKIGVVADTHSQKLPKQMLDDFKKVDFIIHAGDFCTSEDLSKLAKLKEVKAVYGNMDDMSIRKKFPRRQIFSCGEFFIGVFHGEGPPKNLFEVVKAEFKNEKVNVIVFGHSHQPLNEISQGVLYFNPGSPNDLVFAPYRSYGILEITDDKIKGKIIKVKGRNG